MGLLIRDGYTLDGKIPAKPGLHGEVKFSYRPALPERVVEFLRADTSTPVRELANTIKLLSEHLVAWDEECDPTSPETLRRVPHSALQLLVNHVTGYSATDWAEREKN